jgi:phosphoglycerate dehydrogenase-like enzyme
MPEMAAKPVAILTGGRQVFPYVYPESLIQQLGEDVTWGLPHEQTLQEQDGSMPGSPELPSSVEFIFSTWGMPRLEKELLDRLPNLKAVFYAAGTVRSFVTDESWKRGVRIFSAAHINAIPVAEFTVARIILGLKHAESLRIRALADWKAAAPVKLGMQGNYRSRVGLISYGSIARLVREHLRSFDHEVWVYDPFLTEAQAREAGVRLAGLEEIFRECHAVSLHTPQLAQTVGMIRGEHFAAMRKGAVFINTARGAVIRQTEMCESLRSRTDLTAYLDVLEPEPPHPEETLLSLPNVHVTPHIAGSMGHECQRMGVAMVEAFRNWQAGERSELEVVEADMDMIA